MLTIICHVSWTTPCIKQPCPVVFESCRKCWWLCGNNYGLAIDKLNILTWLKRLTVSKSCLLTSLSIHKTSLWLRRLIWYSLYWSSLSARKGWLRLCCLSICKRSLRLRVLCTRKSRLWLRFLGTSESWLWLRLLGWCFLNISESWLRWRFLCWGSFYCWCVILELTSCKCCCNFFFSRWTTIDGFKKV